MGFFDKMKEYVNKELENNRKQVDKAFGGLEEAISEAFVDKKATYDKFIYMTYVNFVGKSRAKEYYVSNENVRKLGERFPAVLELYSKLKLRFHLYDELDKSNALFLDLIDKWLPFIRDKVFKEKVPKGQAFNWVEWLQDKVEQYEIDMVRKRKKESEENEKRIKQEHEQIRNKIEDLDFF